MKFLKRMVSYLAVIVTVMATSGVGKSQCVDENSSETLLLCSYNQGDYADFIFDGQINEKQGKEKKKEQKEQKEIVDTDGDGVPDSEDLCPYVPGSKKAQGCPDKDDDGVPDFMDECPDEPGLPGLKGCPDRDGDGIPDHKDKCPDEKGPSWNNGCPVDRATGNNNRKPTNAGIDSSMLKALFLDSIRTKESQVAEVFTPRKDIFYYGLEPGKDPNYYEDLARSLAMEMEERQRQENEAKRREGHIVGEVSSNNNAKPANTPEKQIKLWKVSQRDIILSNDEIKTLDDILNNLEFVKGRMSLIESSYDRLEQFSDLLKKKYSWKVVFHCYTNEGGNDYRNQNLASNRCQHVISELRKKGIEYNRMKMEAHGSTTDGNNRFEVEITR